MAICGIYKIISPSERVYIGQAVNINRRFHRYKSLDCLDQIKLYRSFMKHGVKNHVFEIIEECSEEDLNCRERYWQDFYNVLSKNGLNCVLQECGEERRVISEETREKMSKKSKGRVWSQESKEKSRLAKIGDKNPMYGKSGENSPTFGTKHTEETILKIKEAIKNSSYVPKPISEEHKKRISMSNSKKVINTLTKIVYDSIKDASIQEGINWSTLRWYLQNPNSNKTDLKYYNN